MTKTEALRQIAEEAVPDNLDLWPQVRARVKLDVARRPARQRRLVGAMVGVLLLALSAGALSLWGSATAVSAESILDQAQATAASPKATVRTYHLQMVQVVPGKDNATVHTEIWFGGPERQRSRSEIKDKNGASLGTSEVVFNHADVWLVNSDLRQTPFVHTIGTTWNEPAEDPARQNSLTDVLAKYSSPKSCMDARLQGEGTVAGQATYVMVVTPKPEGCTMGLGDPKADAKARAAASEKAGATANEVRRSPDSQLGQMLVWVDKQSFLPLRTEVRNPAGDVLDRSEVTSVEYNVDIPDSIFSYTPPPGARVFEYHGGTGADVKAALCNAAKGRCMGTK